MTFDPKYQTREAGKAIERPADAPEPKPAMPLLTLPRGRNRDTGEVTSELRISVQWRDGKPWLDMRFVSIAPDGQEVFAQHGATFRKSELSPLTKANLDAAGLMKVGGS